MIKVQQLTKTFDEFKALDNLDLNVKKGSIYGLIGVNGSGKTTVIKHITGLYRQDSGSVLIDNHPVYDDKKIKERVGFIPDDLYFFPNYTIKMLAGYYENLYKNWNNERYKYLMDMFGLNYKRKISKFSKGMQKQTAFVFAMSIMPDLLILDEPIDGLDPLVRKNVIKEIVKDVAERETSVLVSSHNLKEMEGICDSIGILKSGHMMIERDLDELISDIHKIQVAYGEGIEKGIEKYASLNILHYETRGSVEILVIRGKKDKISQKIMELNPLVFDILPLSLEETFIYEMEGDHDEIPV